MPVEAVLSAVERCYAVGIFSVLCAEKTPQRAFLRLLSRGEHDRGKDRPNIPKIVAVLLSKRSECHN